MNCPVATPAQPPEASWLSPGPPEFPRRAGRFWVAIPGPQLYLFSGLVYRAVPSDKDRQIALWRPILLVRKNVMAFPEARWTRLHGAS
jgi:hypothetical protein